MNYISKVILISEAIIVFLSGYSFFVSSTVASTYTFASVFPQCFRSNPSIMVTPSATQWVQPSHYINYSVTVKNNDSSECQDSKFTIIPTFPKGIIGSLNFGKITLSPGASVIVNLQVAANVSATSGIYLISLLAKNNSAPLFSDTTTASLGVQPSCVYADPIVTITPMTQYGLPASTLTYVATITNQDTAGCEIGMFNIQAAIPVNFISIPRSTVMNLYPGDSGTVVFKLKSPATAILGNNYFYIVAVNTADNHFQGYATANYVVNRTILSNVVEAD